MKPEKNYLAPKIEMIFMSKDVVRTSGGTVTTTAVDLTDTDGYNGWTGDGWSKSVDGEN